MGQETLDVSPKESPVESGATVSHIAFKPPTFDETCATKWFRIIESMFSTSRISQSATKFNHVLSNLPIATVNKIPDATLDTQDYEKIKEAVIGLYAVSKPELFENLISKNNIIFTKPSEYLADLRKIAQQLNVNDDFLKLKFLKTIPDSIRLVIVGQQSQTTTLEEMARLADALMEYETKSMTVNKVGADSQHRNRGFTRQRVNYMDDAIPPNVRAFYANQRPNVCRAHIYFGERARTCKPWCILKSNRVRIAPSSRRNSFSSPSRSDDYMNSEN